MQPCLTAIIFPSGQFFGKKPLNLNLIVQIPQPVIWLKNRDPSGSTCEARDNLEPYFCGQNQILAL